MVDLKSKLDNFYPDNLRVVKLYFRSPSIDNDEKISFNNFELKMDEDLTFMWNTFQYYETKCLVELDAKIAISIEDILKLLKLRI